MISTTMRIEFNADDRLRIDRFLELFEKYVELLRIKAFDEEQNRKIAHIRANGTYAVPRDFDG